MTMMNMVEYDNDSGYEKDDNVGDYDNGYESGGWLLMMMIVMTIKMFVGLLRIQKPSNCDKFSRLITNCSKILNFFVPAKYCNQFIGFGKTNNPVGG